MPWHVEQGGGTCAAGEWAVIKNSDGSTEGCHPSKAKAEAQMAALYANEPAANGRAGTVPAGSSRMQPFAAELRTATLERDGKQLRTLEGVASTTEQPYEMWDIFGPYSEIVARDAFDATLAASPDVAYLVNHRGMTMARTTNGSLELKATDEGLWTRAVVNPERSDVRDLVTAIEDGHITEMSFAFVIEDGAWNDDLTEYRINRVNLDRGDVSAVTYGANPYPSVAARAREILADLAHLPAGAARAALDRLQARPDLAPPVPEGRSVALELALLELDET